MLRKSEFHGLGLTNIPHINLRAEFEQVFKRFEDESFLLEVREWQSGGIVMPTYVWLSYPHTLFSLVIQQAVMGVESYLPGAVYFQSGMSGRLTTELAALIRNPFAIKAKGRVGTAKRYYVLLPSLLSEKLALDTVDPSLWNDVQLFYRDIRNALFHGAQCESDDPSTIQPALRLIANIYKWIDSWHDPRDLYRGFEARRPVAGNDDVPRD